MTTPFTHLATYLTNSRRVAQNSMFLEISGDCQADAEDFFALRTAFGITGYMNSGEALAAIQDTLFGTRS